jgi:hypothetical protein
MVREGAYRVLLGKPDGRKPLGRLRPTYITISGMLCAVEVADQLM